MLPNPPAPSVEEALKAKPNPAPLAIVIAIRRARPTDAEAIARIMNEPGVYAGTLQLPHTDAEIWRTRLADQLTAGRAEISIVAEIDGEVVGSAGLHPVSPATRRRHAMGLGISVATAWQGQGVGRKLIAALCEYADRWAGVLRIELTVFCDNPRAIALYRSFDFQIEGTHTAYALRDGVYVDTYSMARLHPDPPQLPA
jgi:putative acetyltransferase